MTHIILEGNHLRIISVKLVKISAIVSEAKIFEIHPLFSIFILEAILFGGQGH